MHLNENNTGEVIEKLFKKSYFISDLKIDFDDTEVYKNSLEIFKYDYQRYYESNQILLENVFLKLELVGILLYRIANQYFKKGDEFVATHYSNLGRLLSGFEIYYSAEIGKGLKINHGLGTVIGARVQIGKNALIHQNVTFGDKEGERPILKDHVTVYAGAKVIGGIVCGNHSIIAANCVCFMDLPDYAVIAGVPGKIIKK
ncbi:hypothetical protein M0M57_00275 [Flavobacterium azooxidireducens]|uniref:Serine acetyltransferase n=1 Tax=Flavobacterium azooxidireducens TaxID=1871076 RepID=A0ABY4KES1_9FLAO|nr:hypothetical protein [Flavobacterium azooxidireducens]UPQ79291.1 hypothetical protein M0M57_00275 [Flavobacterium azooxidireducens]